jgi:WXG100 family type VII secretion target
MATFTDVQAQQIKQVASAINQTIDTLRDIQNSLGTNVVSRLSPCWDGEAGELFFRQFNGFNASLQKLVNDYGALNETLATCGRTYQQADNLVITAVNRLQQ